MPARLMFGEFVRMRMCVIVFVQVVIMPVETAHVMVMAGLWQSQRGFVADDLDAVSAELAIHVRLSMNGLMCSLFKHVGQERMGSKMFRAKDFDLRALGCRLLGPGMNLFDQHAGE